MLNVGDIVQETTANGVTGTVIASKGSGVAKKYMVQFGPNSPDFKWLKERQVKVVTRAPVKKK